jgi:hypothetical protein
MIKGETGIQQRPTIDADTQASLDTFKTVVPFAKDHKEASKYLNDMAAQVAADPVKGWRSILESQGISIASLLTDAERQQLTGSPEPMAPAPTGEEAVVTAWQESRKVSDADLNGMLEIVASSQFKKIPGESIIDGLNRAYKAFQRARPSRHKAMGDSLEASLRSIADKRYGSQA